MPKKRFCFVEWMNEDAEPVSETLTGGDRDGRAPPEIQTDHSFPAAPLYEIIGNKKWRVGEDSP